MDILVRGTADTDQDDEESFEPIDESCARVAKGGGDLSPNNRAVRTPRYTWSVLNVAKKYYRYDVAGENLEVTCS